MIKLKEQIKRIRVEKGFSSVAVEDLLSIGRTTQSRMEAGSMPITTNYIKNFAKQLDLTAEEERKLLMLYSKEVAKDSVDKTVYYLDLKNLSKTDKEYSVRIATSYPLLNQEDKEIIKNIVKG